MEISPPEVSEPSKRRKWTVFGNSFDSGEDGGTREESIKQSEAPESTRAWKGVEEIIGSVTGIMKDVEEIEERG